MKISNYIILGLSTGAGIGIMLGIATSNIGLGLSMGAGLGLVFGIVYEKKRKKR